MSHRKQTCSHSCLAIYFLSKLWMLSTLIEGEYKYCPNIGRNPTAGISVFSKSFVFQHCKLLELLALYNKYVFWSGKELAHSSPPPVLADFLVYFPFSFWACPFQILLSHTTHLRKWPHKLSGIKKNLFHNWIYV